MFRIVRRHLSRRADGDEGIALVVAIALIGVVSVLMMALIAVAMAETRASGRDRQRSQGVMAAEARVDQVVADIQSRPVLDLPCGALASERVSVVSDRLDVAVTVRYFDAAGVEIPCTDIAAVQLAQATVSATAVSEPIANQSPAVRTVETLLRLEPQYGNDLDKAIFGNAGIRLSNHAAIYGLDGEPNADIYTNGDVACNNNQHFYGSIYAQGSVSMANSCVVEGDVHARLGFTATNPGVTVNGRVLVSAGNINLGPATLGQQARASGTVTGNVCTGAQGAEKCFRGVSVAPPPAIAFPVMNWVGAEAEWAANGYTTVINIPGTYGGTNFPCGWWNGRRLVGSDGKQSNMNGKVDGAAAWVFENGYKLTGPTVLVSTCSQALSFQGAGIKLNNNLAVFANGGVTFSGNSPIESTNADHRNLYLVQPYSARPMPCTSDGIALDNQVTVAPNVSLLLYSPCNIRKANQSTHYGQIYAGGQANIDNKLTMYFQPLPVWGITTASSAIESYAVEILFKRENA